MTNVERLTEALVGKKIMVDVSESEAATKILETAESVGPRKRNQREILKHCIEGTALELGIAKLTNGSLNTQKPDFVTFDRNTFAWDVLAFDLRLEIKPQIGTHFALSDNSFRVVANNIEHFDFIVTAISKHVEKTIYEVKPRWIIAKADFRKHMRRSDYEGFYYHYQYPHILCN